MIYETHAQCAAAFSHKLSVSVLGDTHEVVASRLASQFETPASREESAKFGLIVKRWVIRDDDLKLVEELNRAILAAAGVGFFVDSRKITAAAVAGLAVALFSVIRNASRYAARFSDDELVVLWAIKESSERLNSETLFLSRFEGRQCADGSVWTLALLENTLRLLKDYPTSSGVRRFIAQDGHGRWGLEGV